jgi:long-subunit fatty acid transport protein
MKGIGLLLVILIMASQAYAQKEYDLLGKGARAAGMAYAFNAIADDATAISWNPAGIVQIKNPEIAFQISNTVTNYDHEIHGDRVYKPLNTVNYLGFVYPLKIKKRT